MKLEPTPISDLFVLHRPLRKDDRGNFSRLFGEDDIAAAGRPTKAFHVNTSSSKNTGTLRGIHFQYPPYLEAKVVACTAGAIWDVGVDLRPGSSTKYQYFGALLTPDNGQSLIVPEGFGHAFITLEPNSTVVYVNSSVYALEHESGICFDDPLLNIDWPIEPIVISDKDQSWGSLESRMQEIDRKFSQ